MALPALPPNVDTRSITERVNVLIRDYNGGRVDDLAQALIDIAALQALSSADATTFLTADVALNNTANFFNGPNTGSIGAAGQKWAISGMALANDTAGGAAVIEAAIFNGSTYIAANIQRVDAFATQSSITIPPIVVTLTGATTFTLRAKDQTSTSGNLLANGLVTAGANKATAITAMRLS